MSETPETAVVPEVNTSDAGIPVLNVAGSNSGAKRQTASVAKSEERSYNYATVHNRTLPVGQRRRRSASSKKLSDQRQIDNGEILIRKETDYLAKVEEPVVEKKAVTEPLPEVKNKNTKNSKDQNKKGKEKKSSSKNVNNSEKGKKRIVINSSTHLAKAENGKKRGSEANAQSGKTVAAAQVAKQTEPQASSHKRHTSLAKRRKNSGK